MKAVIWIIFIPFGIFVLMNLFPHQAIAIIAELRRRFRLHIINRHGRIAAKHFFEELKEKYEGDYSKEALEEVFEENKDVVIERLGTKYANDFLGEPSILERYF